MNQAVEAPPKRDANNLVATTSSNKPQKFLLAVRCEDIFRILERLCIQSMTRPPPGDTSETKTHPQSSIARYLDQKYSEMQLWHYDIAAPLELSLSGNDVLELLETRADKDLVGKISQQFHVVEKCTKDLNDKMITDNPATVTDEE